MRVGAAGPRAAVGVTGSSPPCPVTEFAKRTGDFPSLSAADLQVLALTCQLQAETAGPGSVRLQPPDKVRAGWGVGMGCGHC